MKIEIPDEFAEMLSGIMAQIVGKQPEQRARPYTVKEFAEAANMSITSVRRRIKARTLKKVEGTGKVLIPVAELERFIKS